MGKVRITGPGALDFVNRIVANDLHRIADGQAQYSMVCTEDGGIIDDLIVYRFGPEDVFIVPNASNAATVVSVFRGAALAGIEVADQHHDLGIIAVQGPRSADVLAAVGVPTEQDYMAMVEAAWNGHQVLVCRTGYTGERGFELIAPSEALGTLWDALVGEAATVGGGPAGLGARDTLRTEMGYPLHGQDISTATNPVEAGLGWAVGWDIPVFFGRDGLLAVKASGPARRLRGVKVVGRGIPRPHMGVYRDGTQVGETTSGTFSPTLRQGIALAYLPAEIAVGDFVQVDVRGTLVDAEVVTLPFVPSHVR
jgi:aminomethyltransferase